jgi:polyisoprenoid-binding protein YceI
MKDYKIKKLLSFIFLVALCASAQAKDWQIDPAHSMLTFTGDQNGEKFSGGFKKFTAQISLDPDHPETGKISVSVDTGSAFAGSSDRDELLPQKEWFDVGAFPQAQFTSTSIRKISEASYEATGTLSIKGISKNLVLPFTLAPEGPYWHATGHILVMRSDFGVGLGMFKGENYVKNAVDVAIDLMARPNP